MIPSGWLEREIGGVSAFPKEETVKSRAWAFPALAAWTSMVTAAFPSAGPSDVGAELVAIKAKTMAADYRADLPALAEQRAAALPLADDPESGYLARYWAGFASWRSAINGANGGMSPDLLKSHLDAAVADFESSTRLRGDFADGYAAAASVHGWLAAFQGGDAAAAGGHIAESRRLLAKAKELAPDNPRVLWVEGGVFLFTPVAYGGDPDRAIEIYRRMSEVSDAEGRPDSPQPDWGKPEALMSLAFAHLNHPTPDLSSALKEAKAALALQPDWAYVRDILLPQIEARRGEESRPRQR